MNIKEKIENFIPFNEQEEKDKRVFLEYIDKFDDVLTRKNTIGHFTSSNWVVNKERTKVLMVYHNIYNSWSWTGGHADGESDFLKTATKELEEEAGIKNYKVLSDNIFSLECACVNGHEKRGEYVSSHMHLNVTFLIEVDENETLKVKEDENSGVKWINIEDLPEAVSEDWMRLRIYNKLIQKVKRGDW